ncbi:MAG: ABC transporter substrate-binding protein [Dehalococcoidia bacterium]
MRFWKLITVLCFIITLIALPLMTACGGDDETPTESPTSSPTEPGEPTTEPADEVTIKIGNLTDKTGPASQAMQVVDMALKDLVRYYNENNFIPNVKLEVVDYDTQYDPSRDIPAYQWLVERGVDFCYTGLPTTPLTLKSLVNKDEVVLFSSSGLEDLGDPPGWVFVINPAFSDVGESMLKWIAENDWDYEADGPAKLGMATWVTPAFEEFINGFNQYIDDHPEQFEWEGLFTEQPGTFTWDIPAQELKDADYVFVPGAGMIPFVKTYRDAGGKATLLMTDSHIAFLGMLRDARLVDEMNGTLCFLPCRWWNEDAELVNLAKQLFVEYHGESELEKQIRRGGAYMTSMHMLHGMLEAVKKAVADFGAENFSSQTFYDSLTDFSINQGEAYRTWGWTDTDRFGYDYFRVYEFDGEKDDFISTGPDWYPYIQ